jgi:RimJ/RimL family protein N-acetyltransferase
MTTQEAEEIAQLINNRNHLIKNYTFKDILSKKECYVFIKEDNKVIACAASNKIQWYQHEITHVSISEHFEGKGYGSRILALAEKKAIENNVKILQCTIRTNNINSIRLFSKKGYKEVNTFFYPKTGNWVYIYQKVI